MDGDYVHAQGTTLGGDDGIAVAMALAILDDDSIPHPPLEVLFTTEEETGMDGARYLDCSKLSAKYMINIDSEEEGVITVGCAGGLKSHGLIPVTEMTLKGQGTELKLPAVPADIQVRRSALAG